MHHRCGSCFLSASLPKRCPEPRVGSNVIWQRPIENFAASLLATDGDRVFIMDINGNVSCYNLQSGESIWNGSSVGNYFAKGLAVAEGKFMVAQGLLRWAV